MSHLTTRDRTVSPDGYAAALRILRRLLAGIERPPALRLGDMLLHELESHPEYTLIIRDPGLLRRLVLRPDPLLLAEAYFRGTIDIEGDLYTALGLKAHFERFSLSWRDKLALLRDALLLRVSDQDGLKPSRSLASRVARRFSHRHSRQTDQAAISFHYDVSNAFYGLWLDARGSTHVAISRRRMTRWTRLSATSWSTSAASCACSEANACSTSAAAGARSCAGRQENMASVRTASRSANSNSSTRASASARRACRISSPLNCATTVTSKARPFSTRCQALACSSTWDSRTYRPTTRWSSGFCGQEDSSSTTGSPMTRRAGAEPSRLSSSTATSSPTANWTASAISS